MVDAVTHTPQTAAPVAPVPTDVHDKYARLCERLRALLPDGLLIAFSGGVDSAFLLWAAHQQQRAAGGRLLALTAVSASMARVERDDARAFADALGVEHQWHESHELGNPAYVANDASRCYHCKTELFRISRDIASHALAEGRGFRWLAYGYNDSDRGDVRPGHRAALENDVLAPLAEAGLGKDDIRVLMRANGVALSEKPASPCLSSRLMTGVRVTPVRLQHVEDMESLLRARGLRVFRVRVHEFGARSLLRVEVAPDELARAFELRDELAREGQRHGYHWVTLDLAGYRLGGGTQ